MPVAFNVDPMLRDDPRATARLNAIRSDGVRSHGSACGLRPRDPDPDPA